MLNFTMMSLIVIMTRSVDKQTIEVITTNINVAIVKGDKVY